MEKPGVPISQKSGRFGIWMEYITQGFDKKYSRRGDVDRQVLRIGNMF